MACDRILWSAGGGGWSVLTCIYYPRTLRGWKAEVQPRISQMPSKCPNSYIPTFILRLELSHKSVDYFAGNCVSMLILGGPRYISRYSDAGIGVRFRARQDTLYSPRRPERLCGSPATYSIRTGVKLPGRETDHSPLSGADVKIARRWNSAPAYVIITSCLTKHRDSFTFGPTFLFWGTSKTFTKVVHITYTDFSVAHPSTWDAMWTLPATL
jgi:hypothetical protein